MYYEKTYVQFLYLKLLKGCVLLMFVENLLYNYVIWVQIYMNITPSCVRHDFKTRRKLCIC